ncbi:MAG: hypothetical protein SynsKO_19760 [Synoicihabitans sp.]
MKSLLKRSRAGLLAVAVFFAPFSSSAAIDPSIMGEIAKAQIIIGQIQEIRDTMNALTVDLKAPKPRYDNKGKFLLPYTQEGEPTEWAGKIVQSQVGKMAGEKAGNMAANALASKVPFGGLAGGFMKKKAKESAAVMAMGGKKFIKETSDQSFKSLEDYAVFLQARHGNDPDFKMTLAAAVALYPDLEHRFAGYVKKAYRKQGL